MSGLVMYILVNNDLQMGKGKIAAQVGHVVQQIIEDIIIKKYESKKILNICKDYDGWKNSGCAKIILKATKEQLEILKNMDNARFVIDAGKTQIEAGSLTVVGFPPTKTLGNIMKDYKLL